MCACGCMCEFVYMCGMKILEFKVQFCGAEKKKTLLLHRKEKKEMKKTKKTSQVGFLYSNI